MQSMISDLSQKTEKLLRLIVPVLIYIAIVIINKRKSIPTDGMELTIVIVGFGYGSYILYRNLCAVADKYTIRRLRHLPLDDYEYRAYMITSLYTASGNIEQSELRGYIYYKFSEIHSMAMMVIASVIALYQMEAIRIDLIVLLAFIGLCLCIQNYYEMHRTQIEIIKVVQKMD